MLVKRPRARRYTLSAQVQVTDLDSERMIQERTSDLSQFGCYVRTSNPCAVGTKVRVKITYKGAVFTALGHIVNVRENGMGVQFSGLAPRDEMILEIWMAELRSDGTRA